MSRHSSTSSRSETKGKAEAHRQDGSSILVCPDGSIEKTHHELLRKTSTRNSNIQAVPGVPLDEGDFDGQDAASQSWRKGDGGEPRPSGGLAGMMERVVSRVSTKSSWNPGPPPDGGVRAWTAGQ